MRFARFALAIFCLPVALLAVACGDDDPEPTPAASATEATPTATETATATATGTATPPPTDTPGPEPTARPFPTPTPDNSIVVACGDILAPLDKDHRLPADCAPGDLVTLEAHLVSAAGQAMRAEAAGAFAELFAAAQEDGFTILAASAYRSYQTQVAVYGSHVAQLGEAAADRVSARPGHSEHQLGTTTDVTSESAGYSLGGFEGTPEAAWLAANSWRFGFIISYPAGKEHITGYSYEPWHIRYIGKARAQQAYASGLTLHEWLLR